ncbi:small heat shock protein, chloroplastic-like [Apium graveolens]|uniref:small heat shock protein, chloroplastic-like n=1 Tax=Apium graveolens TaxID=4045 RepID=UPI003D7AD60C
MAQCLSNIIISHPVLYQKNTATTKTKWPLSSNGLKNGKDSIRASVNKDSLDHLQRTNNYKPQQQEQLKKRSPQVTPIGLWDRFPAARTMQQMMDTMDRIIDDPYAYSSGNAGSWPSQLTSETGKYNRGRTPWDIKEREAGYKMRFDMPGMTKQDVKVWVEEKMLVVKAEKNTKTNDEEKGSQKEEEWPEESFGKYSFRIVLPENIQYENIRAEVKDGVLYINTPKASVSSKILDINVE